MIYFARELEPEEVKNLKQHCNCNHDYSVDEKDEVNMYAFRADDHVCSKCHEWPWYLIELDGRV